MKKVDFKLLAHYISKYEDPYGTVEIMNVGYNLIVKFYNGGWSENEYLDRLIRKRYRNNVIVDNHPIMILRFFLRSLILIKEQGLSGEKIEAFFLLRI